jgi:SAM-dependent methyltransferase
MTVVGPPSEAPLRMNDKLERLYANRFDEDDLAWKKVVWRILWRRVFSRWIRPSDTVLDIGAGYCEFANSAVARRRVAVDLNPSAAQHAAAGVEVHATSAADLSFLKDGEVDVVFTSNFLEHLPSKAVLSRVFDEVRRVLVPEGTFLVMGPNIRYLAGRYWDYFDHHLPLTDASICEALLVHGFELSHVEPRFLPFTVKNAGPRWPWLVEAYLALRPLSSRLLGKQFLVVATKPAAGA